MLKQAVKLVATCMLTGLLGCGNSGSGLKPVKMKPDSVTVKPPYTGDCVGLLKAAEKMDSVLMHDPEVSRTNANRAMKAFTDYSFFCKNDSIAPVFLIKASQVATSINNFPQAQLALEKCINDFPKFKNRGAAMFLLAQLYDEPRYLNDEAKARQLYDNLISVYPTSEWAANARAARLLLGKTDEQIIKEFNEKNGKKK